MHRVYCQFIHEHFARYRQMLFMMGPRQSGKTTTAQRLESEWENYYYFNWDNTDHRSIILSGPQAIANEAKLDSLQSLPLVVFDEIHKYPDWKNFLKGLYDTYPNQANILVTGSAKLDTYQKGGDSLMGRYFTLRHHPLSIAEILSKAARDTEIRSQPEKLDDQSMQNLWEYGGYPDPYLEADERFYLRWKNLRYQQYLKEDIRDLSQVMDINKLALLADLITINAGQLTSYSSLAKNIRADDKSIRSWTSILESLYYCFAIKPWSKNITRSLLKEPKFYLWDWSLCKTEGSKAENLVACHLLKAVHYWTDCGFGEYDLFYLRDKDKRECDFLVVKNNQPWILVEVKSNNRSLSPSLKYFAEKLNTPHNFQVVVDMPYVDINCFDQKRPIIVPMLTFLSQLV